MRPIALRAAVVLALLMVFPAAAQAARDTVITVQPGGFFSDGYVTSKDNDPGFWFTAFGSGATPPFECRMDEGEWTACSSPARYADLPDGIRKFQVRTVEDGGTGSPASFTWRVDTIGPALELTSKPPKNSNSKSATFTYSYTDASMERSYVLCAIGIGEFQLCNSPGGFSDLKEGWNNVSFIAYDAAENPSNRVDYMWWVDTVAPATVITSGPSGTTTSRSASLGFHSTESGSTSECKVDGGEFAPCASPLALTDLAESEHTVQIRSIDAAGNTGPAASRTWTIASSAPDTSFVTGPAGLTNVSSAIFVLAGGVSFECKLDGGEFIPCASPVTYSGLAEGSHTLLVRAKDASGTVDPTPASRRWTVDTLAPDTYIEGGPSGAVASTTATFGFSADEGAAYECKLDGGAFAACESPLTLPALAQGAHTLAVRATDAAGNADATPALRAWSVDTVGPVISLTGVPALTTTATSATFAFAADEPATFQCRLGTAAFAPCTSPKTYDGLTPGTRTFEVRAADALGNASAVKQHTWAVEEKPAGEPAPTPTPTPTPDPTATPTPTPTPTTTPPSSGGDRPAPTTPATPAVPRTALSLELGSLRLRARDGLKITVSSTRAATVALVVRSGSRATRAVAVRVPAGGRATVRVKLTAAMRRALGKARRLKVSVVAVAADGATTSRPATLKLRR